MDSIVHQRPEGAGKLFRENNMISITLLAHATNSSQSLVFVFSRALTKLKASATVEFDDDPVISRIRNGSHT
jgi:hypothetical protein